MHWVTWSDPGVRSENIPRKQGVCLQIKVLTISNLSRQCLPAEAKPRAFMGQMFLHTHTKKENQWMSIRRSIWVCPWSHHNCKPLECSESFWPTRQMYSQVVKALVWYHSRAVLLNKVWTQKAITFKTVDSTLLRACWNVTKITLKDVQNKTSWLNGL